MSQLNTIVNDLVFTSCDDMKSSLQCALANDELNQEILEKAINLARAMKEKTRIKILQSYYHKYTGSYYV